MTKYSNEINLNEDQTSIKDMYSSILIEIC